MTTPAGGATRWTRPWTCWLAHSTAPPRAASSWPGWPRRLRFSTTTRLTSATTAMTTRTQPKAVSRRGSAVDAVSGGADVVHHRLHDLVAEERHTRVDRVRPRHDRDGACVHGNAL